MENIEEIQHITSREDLEYIKTKTASDTNYFESLVYLIHLLRDVPGVDSVVKDYINQFKREEGELCRSYIHLFIAARLKSLDLLSAMEAPAITTTGMTKLDLVLKSGAGIELTRFSSNEILLDKKIASILDQSIKSPSGLLFIIRLKTSSVKHILAKLNVDLHKIIKDHKPISNECYDLSAEATLGDISFSAVPNIRKPVCISSAGNFAYVVEFTEKAKLEAVCDAINIDKLGREASKRSKVIILDFTDSIVVKDDAELVRLLDVLKTKVSSQVQEMIIGLRCTPNSYSIRKILRENSAEDVKDLDKKLV